MEQQVVVEYEAGVSTADLVAQAVQAMKDGGVPQEMRWQVQTQTLAFAPFTDWSHEMLFEAYQVTAPWLVFQQV